MRLRVRLSTQTLLLQLAVVGIVLAVFALAANRVTGRQLEEQYGERALAVAETVAALPAVRQAFDEPDPSATLQPLAETIRTASGVSFIVVANRDGIRYSHPDRRRIGQRVSTDPSEALSGRPGIYVQRGSLGRSVRGKVPVFGPPDRVIGLVSVGIFTSDVAARQRRELLELLGYVGVALVLAALGALLLARRVRRQTLGLEPDEIALLCEQREAMLLGIREGVVGVGTDGRINLVNAEACRLLELDPSCHGRPVDEVAAPGRIRQLLTGRMSGTDVVALANDRIVVVNRMPVEVRDELIASVVTLQDRTELEILLRELDRVHGLTETLRAQAHEFPNRLHTIAGLIELGRTDDAVGLITQASSAHEELIEALTERIGEPALAALLLGKAAAASERGLELRLADDSYCDASLKEPTEVLTVVGNLVDNALEAAASSPDRSDPGYAEVSVRTDGDGVSIRVHDSGPGVDPGLAEVIFCEGFTTKANLSEARRGLGLALVAQIVRRRNGRVKVANDGGAVFLVELPAAHDVRRAKPAVIG